METIPTWLTLQPHLPHGAEGQVEYQQCLHPVGGSDQQETALLECIYQINQCLYDMNQPFVCKSGCDRTLVYLGRFALAVRSPVPIQRTRLRRCRQYHR